MANDYLISKWRKWFGFFDHNADGKVCYADMELARGKFTRLHHLTGEEKKSAMDSFTTWYIEYVLWGTKEITVDGFIKKQNAAFGDDKGKFIERIQKCEEIICGFVDADHDGIVTEQDLIIIFKAGGHEDEAKDKVFFKEFDPVDGKVSLKKMIQYWSHYLTCEDSSLPDPVARGFEDGI